MRYLGNKTKLLDSIVDFAAAQGAVGRLFIDCFAGTAAVGARFRERRFKVIGCDLLRSSYVSQVALLEVARPPRFAGLLALPELRRACALPGFAAALSARAPRASALARVVTFLDAFAEPEDGLITRNYAPSGARGCRYFRDAHARKIDGCLRRLRDWRRAGQIEERELCLLLHAVLGAADRVANTTGVYAAYLKQWQSNTEGLLTLRVPPIGQGPIGRATCGDANALVATTPCDVLYIDPPYNTRQYAAYYHIREVMAEIPSIENLTSYERALYGRNGLRPYKHLLSEYCIRRRRAGTPLCELAFTDLIRGARARHIIVSYNEEGIISRDIICRALAEYSGDALFNQRHAHAIRYKRFRSDANGHNGRQYKVLEGKTANEVDEWLLYARCPNPGAW